MARLKENIKRFFLSRGWQIDQLHPARFSVRLARKLGYGLYPIAPAFPVDPPINGQDLVVLGDPDFQNSVRMVREHTLLDVARLANLWNLARQTGPGTILEAGTFRGGGALHLANACCDRPLFVFDTFEGFRRLTPGLDDVFDPTWFRDTTEEHVRHLFQSAGRDATIVKGFFPESAAGLELGPVAFCHLDVDLYEATRDSLSFLANRLAPRSLIVLDDYQRTAHGVDRALAEFLEAHPSFTSFPMFPGQAMLFSRPLWDR
jgi:O-methyltransferase